LALVGGAAGYETAPTAQLQVPVRAPGIQQSQSGTVQSQSETSIAVQTAAGARVFKFRDGTLFERLVPAKVEEIQPGEWLNVGAVPNSQTLFALSGLIVLKEKAQR